MPHDILILGGGPAGLSTALHLAQLAPELKPRILVLEKAHYPRPKLCAGALLVDAEVVLERLGLDVGEIPHVDACEAHLDFAGQGLTISFPGTHALRMIRRDEFDAWLAEKTRALGIEIREGVTVRKVEPRPASVLVETDAGMLEAHIVVGADGTNGITRRCILPNARVRTARALEVIVPVIARERSDEVEDPAQRGNLLFAEEGALRRRYADGMHPVLAPRASSEGSAVHEQAAAYFDFFPVLEGIGGYMWDFPTQVKGQPMRCWGIYDTNILAGRPRPQLKRPLADEMKRQGRNLDDYELQGHPIRWFSPFDQFSVPRVLLVGDAAGVDGFFGEGISMALAYGRIAAQLICDSLANDDFSFCDYRWRILRSPLGKALTIRTGITQILYHLHWAWFQKFFWRIFGPVVRFVGLRVVLNWARRME